MVIERGTTGQISWLSTGPDPRIGFLHGYSDAAACWSPLLAALAGRWNAVAVDARGHGESGLPDELFGPQAMAADTAGVLRALTSKPVVVAGTSMGGLTAAVLAAHRPELVGALVLADPAPGTRVRTAPAMPVPEWVQEVKALDRNAMIAKGRADNPLWPEDELLPWAVANEQLNVRLHALPWEDPVYLPDLFGRIRCPTLMILGDQEAGSVVDSETAQDCASAASGRLEIVRLSGAGHAVCRERRAEFLALLTAFLEQNS